MTEPMPYPRGAARRGPAPDRMWEKPEPIGLLELDRGGVPVAEYLTVLPPLAVLQALLQEPIANARQRILPNRPDDEGDA